MTNPDFYSFFAYVSALGLTMFFAGRYEKSHKRKYLYISYLVTLLFCGCRFFVGNDYWGYYNLFRNVQDYPEYAFLFAEPAYVFLNVLFSRSTIGYFFVLFASSAITYSLVFFLLSKYRLLKWGVFAIYTLGFLIIANDQVRQLIAIPIFFFAIKYIEDGKMLKYMLCIVFAMTFHYSAAICIILYFIRYIRVNKKTMVILLCVAFLLKLSGVAEAFMHSMSNYISFFNESYADKALNDKYYSGETFGIQLLYFWLVSFIIFVSLPSQTYDNSYIKIFSLGACLYMLCWGQMLFERMSLYMFELIIFTFPIAMKQKNILIKSCVLMCLTYFTLQSLFALEKNGAIPYRTFFYEDMHNPIYDKDTQSDR